MQYSTLIAIMAALSSASAAAVLPRETTSRFWSSQLLPTTTSSSVPNNNVLMVENGKFWLGNTVGPRKGAIISCAADTGVATTCALNAKLGPQPVYIAADGSLSYVAQKAAVPAGSNAKVWGSNGLVFYEKTAATSSTQSLNGEFVACQNSNNWQIFALEGYKGCAGQETIIKISNSGLVSGAVYDSY